MLHIEMLIVESHGEYVGDTIVVAIDLFDHCTVCEFLTVHDHGLFLSSSPLSQQGRVFIL